MKHFFYLFICLFLLVSCSKDSDDKRTEVINNINGKYNLSTMVWDGESAIDLNNDGTTSFDFLEELKGIREWETIDSYFYGKLDIPVNTEYPVRYGGYMNINWPVFRNRERTGSGINYPDIHYGGVYINITADGTIEVRKNVEYQSDDDEYLPSILTSFQIGEGSVLCIIEYEVYDWKTNQVIKAPVRALYERV